MDSFEKRNVKITNSRQFQKLVSLMAENERLAKCLPAFGGAKFIIEEAWDEVAEKVNVYGPPERTGYEWKKIWTDLKCRTKKKICENNKIINNCGEGSGRMLYLSELEQSVDKILDFSTMVASQIFDESSKELEFESDLKDLPEPSEVKTQTEDTAPNVEISKNLKITSNKKAKSPIRLPGKRKYEKRDKQMKLLHQQIKTQEKILEAIQMQATATKTLADGANRQADTLAVIAESTQSIALMIQEAVKYFKSV